jgi:hypothetical protein
VTPEEFDYCLKEAKPFMGDKTTRGFYVTYRGRLYRHMWTLGSTHGLKTVQRKISVSGYWWSWTGKINV